MSPMQATDQNDDESALKYRSMGCVDINVIFRGGPEAILRHQQTVENQATDYNPMVLHLRVVAHCTGIYRNILVCHFRITGSRC